MGHFFFFFFTIAGDVEFGKLLVGGASVDVLVGVRGHGADEALGQQLLDGGAGQRSVQVQTVGQHRGSDHLVLGHLIM